MAIRTHDIAVDGGDHVVHLYECDSELVEAVTGYVAAAVESDEVTIVIATAAHREAFVLGLGGCGIDAVEACAGERLLFLDAAGTMAAFMSGGQIDHDAFHEVIGGLLRAAARSGRGVRAYGEMVSLLWDAGDVVGAIELETLWNDLGRELPFSLYCSYPAASVSGSGHAEALHEVCHLHSSVLRPVADGDSCLAEESSATEVATEVATEIAAKVLAEFAAEPDSPGRVRRLVVSALAEWGCGAALLQDAAVVVSELTTNAVLHAKSPFSISVELADSLLRIVVQDAGSLVRDGDWSPLPTHGLGLLEALTVRWGVEDTPRGKAVWGELRAEADAPQAARGL
jgi:anti-sigma regulatory factor (Ser/Thr protein kinase)